MTRRRVLALVVLGLLVAALAWWPLSVRAPARVEATRTAAAESTDVRALLASLEERRTTERTTTRTEERPGGARVVTVTHETTAATTAAATRVDETATARAAESTRTVVEPRRTSWKAGVAAVWDLRALPGVARIAEDPAALRPRAVVVNLSRRVVGPVWLDLSARTDRTVTLGVSVEW